jgi:hypothetical protein
MQQAFFSEYLDCFCSAHMLNNANVENEKLFNAWTTLVSQMGLREHAAFDVHIEENRIHCFLTDWSINSSILFG